MTKISCIDLFCGVGGLTHGLQNTGIDVVTGVDVEEKCRHPFETNNDAEFVEADVSDLPASFFLKRFASGDIRILAGCAPCQPFSTYSQRYETIGTPRWGLMYHFSRLVRDLRPEIVTMENVPTVSRHQVYDDFVDTLKAIGYNVWTGIVDCSDHGLPQARRRTVLLASRLGPIALEKPRDVHPGTVRDAISGMPRLRAGQTHPDDALHTCPKLSDLNLERIKASRPGGTWRDWPSHLVASCHQKTSGKTYPSVYGRMEWDRPSPTLTTQFFGFGNGRYGHPEQNRAISLREGAILQGFPRHYSFLRDDDPVHFKILGRMIGNAVPVTLGELIGRSIIRSLRNYSHLDKKYISTDELTKKQNQSLVA